MPIGSVTGQNVALAGRYGDNRGSDADSSLIARLWDGDPTAGGSEITGTGYAPITLANTTANFGTPSGGQLGPIVLDYGTAGADDWIEPFYVSFEDTGGNLYDYGEIANPAVINSGDPVSVTTTIVQA